MKIGDLVRIVAVPGHQDHLNMVGKCGELRMYLGEIYVGSERKPKVWAVKIEGELYKIIEPALRLIPGDGKPELLPPKQDFTPGSWDNCPWSPAGGVKKDFTVKEPVDEPA